MSECIISRRGSGKITGTVTQKTVLIVKNTNWTMPIDVLGNQISVRIFGGGGGGYGSMTSNIEFSSGYGATYGAGGGGGNMNNNTLTLSAGTTITIGAGGQNKTAGGTSSFGTYLSATCGESYRTEVKQLEYIGGTTINSTVYHGGYGYGANRGSAIRGAGGGGYYSCGGSINSGMGSGGGGGYGNGGGDTPPGYGGGGGGNNNNAGGNGVCIIQYYSRASK